MQPHRVLPCEQAVRETVQLQAADRHLTSNNSPWAGWPLLGVKAIR